MGRLVDEIWLCLGYDDDDDDNDLKVLTFVRWWWRRRGWREWLNCMQLASFLCMRPRRGWTVHTQALQEETEFIFIFIYLIPSQFFVMLWLISISCSPLILSRPHTECYINTTILLTIFLDSLPWSKQILEWIQSREWIWLCFRTLYIYNSDIEFFIKSLLRTSSSATLRYLSIVNVKPKGKAW